MTSLRNIKISQQVLGYYAQERIDNGCALTTGAHLTEIDLDDIDGEDDD